MSTTLNGNAPVSASTSLLEPTVANFPGLKHAFNFGDETTFGLSGVAGLTVTISDLVGDVVLSTAQGAANVTRRADGHAVTFDSTILDEALESGTWDQPGTKTAVVYCMAGEQGDGNSLCIIGPSVSSQATPPFTGDAIRCNGNTTANTVYDSSQLATVTGTSFTATRDGPMRGLRITPGGTYVTFQAGATEAEVLASVSAATILALDEISPYWAATGAKDYWGFVVFHFETPPSDLVLMQAGAVMRDAWENGNFKIPKILQGYS